jgi:hypothetical protein
MLASSRDVRALRRTHESHHSRTRSKQSISAAWRHYGQQAFGITGIDPPRGWFR